MPEFLRLVSPQDARALLLSKLGSRLPTKESIDTASSLGRVAAEDIKAPHPLPEFERSTVDGYALRAADTQGASDSLPAYLQLMGEVPMGASPTLPIAPGRCLLIHTGGVIPDGADAVVMLEHTQSTRSVGGQASDLADAAASTKREKGDLAPGLTEVEILRPVARGENVIHTGEDVAAGQNVILKGTRMRAPEIGGLMALGVTSLYVVPRPRLGLISSGDEVVPPEQLPRRGEVRDVNAYTLGSVIAMWGGVPAFYGIIPDDPARLQDMAKRALRECDCLVITAGSSASARDQTANVINALGKPGVLVHGISTRPGKPTILGACQGKAVLGLPGNPVSALVNAYLFVQPLIDFLLGLGADRPRPSVTARLTLNIASEAGREDWWPVRLIRTPISDTDRPQDGTSVWMAEPIFGRSNLIFTLAGADGLLRIPAEVTGLSAGATAEVYLL